MVSGLSTNLARDALEAAGAISLLLAASALLVGRVAIRNVCAGQIAACAGAVLVQGGTTGELIPAVVAAMLMASKGAVIWLAVSRIKAEPPPPVAGAAAIAIAAALVLVAMFAARQLAIPPAASASNGFAMILGVVLIGPLIVVARPAAPWTAVGVLSIETGAALAAVAISPAAALVETIVALLAMASIVLALRFERDAPGGA